MERLVNLTISGVGKSNGGKFANVDISGIGSVTDAVEADRISISGKGTIEGDVRAHYKLDISGIGTIHGSIWGEILESSGSGSIKGSVEAKVIESTGILKIEGPVRIEMLTNAGHCSIGSNLAGDKIKSTGLLTVEGSVDAEEFSSYGAFTVRGRLRATRIDIEIRGFAQALEIHGQEINVRGGNLIPLLSKLMQTFLKEGQEPNKLTANLIEGSTISVANTMANLVRGDRVYIGPESVIQEVQYREVLEIDPRAAVFKQTKISEH